MQCSVTTDDAVQSAVLILELKNYVNYVDYDHWMIMFKVIRFDSLLLLWRYNCDRILAFSTISFHLRRSWTCSTHFKSFIFFKLFLTSSSHRDLGLPTGLPVNGFHLYIFFTMVVSDILFTCPNQLNLWALP